MMKRVLKIVGLLVGVVVLAVVAFFVAFFAGNPEVPDGRELEGFVRVVKDGYVGVSVLDAGPGTVAFIDAGNDPSGAALLAELQRRQLGPEAVKAIFLTHGHGDHVAGCHLFPQAEVMALAADVPLAEGKTQGHGPLTRWLPPKDFHTRVTRVLQDGETVQVGDLAVRVFAIPGHTGGSAAYLTRGVLFLGDSADANKRGGLEPAKWPFTDDPEQNRASLKALAARVKPEQLKHLVFAHTGVLDTDAALQAFATK